MATFQEETIDGPAFASATVPAVAEALDAAPVEEEERKPKDEAEKGTRAKVETLDLKALQTYFGGALSCITDHLYNAYKNVDGTLSQAVLAELDQHEHTDVYLAYHASDEAKVEEVNAILNKMDMTTWFANDRNGQSKLENTLAKDQRMMGIEKSQLVLIFVSKGFLFEKSPELEQEWQWIARRKPGASILAVVVDEDCAQTQKWPDLENEKLCSHMYCALFGNPTTYDPIKNLGDMVKRIITPYSVQSRVERQERQDAGACKPPAVVLARYRQLECFNADPENLGVVCEVVAKLLGQPRVQSGDGEDEKYDVFLSYRVFSEKDTTEKIYWTLKAKGFNPFWDRMCLKDAEPWEQGFLRGLANSRYFLAILSRKGLASLALAGKDYTRDNVLKELTMATDLDLPGCTLLVGEYVQRHSTRYLCKFSDFNPIVYLDGLSARHYQEPVSGQLSPDYLTDIKEMFNELFKHQGIHFDPEEPMELEVVADRIASVIKRSTQIDGASDNFDAFFSYTWLPTDKRIALSINQSLKKRGLRVWVDEEQLVGGDLKSQLTMGINDAKIYVVFLSSASLARSLGRKEPEKSNLVFELRSALYKAEAENNDSFVLPILLGKNVKLASGELNGSDFLQKFSDYSVGKFLLD